MDKIKRILAASFCLVALMLSGCDSEKGLMGEVLMPSEKIERGNRELMPENVLQIGDSFEYTPYNATGHLLCSVTDVRVVSDAAGCPPKEMFDAPFFAVVDGEWVGYDYEEWSTEGGAFDRGCRLVLADVTMTNVDAVMKLDNGTFEDSGLFYDPYLFLGYQAVRIADLTGVQTAPDGQHKSYLSVTSDYYSYRGRYHAEDDPDTIGIEPHAIRIAPGETVSFTVGFLLSTDEEGKQKDLSMQWLSVGANTDVETGTFIDTALGGDAE